jgi:Flp pilus assembly protein CpaB
MAKAYLWIVPSNCFSTKWPIPIIDQPPGHPARKDKFMRRNRQILLTVLITAALLALAWTAGSARKTEKMASVLIARCDIPAGSRITADFLSTAQIPEKVLAECYFSDPSAAVGLWTSTPLRQGEFISSQHLTSSASGLHYPDPGPGRRLLTIDLKPADANGFWLAAGSRIDLYLIPGSRESDTIVQVLENIRVMAVLQGETGALAAGSVNTSSSEGKLLCLDLDIEQALLLSSAPGMYDIRLSVINEPEADQKTALRD